MIDYETYHPEATEWNELEEQDKENILFEISSNMGEIQDLMDYYEYKDSPIYEEFLVEQRVKLNRLSHTYDYLVNLIAVGKS